MDRERKEIKIIVIGASAGGFRALPELLSQFPEDLDTAVFIVMHLSKKAIAEVLIHHLQKSSALPCKLASHEEKIKSGTIYIAEPDHHMLLKEDRILITKGPSENLWRPSIDVLFRSAAAAHGPNVIGILLTGMLDDGASGMSAIKRSGGTCIVQDPNEAEFPDMPQSVLNNMQVDHRAHISEMGYIINDILSKNSLSNFSVPEDVKAESEIAERIAIGMDKVRELGNPTAYACPTCGGGLFEINDGSIHRFRCYTGHAFTEEALLSKQAEAMEESLWFSIRMMEERRNMLENMIWKAREKELGKSLAAEEDQARQLKIHIERLREILLNTLKEQKQT